MGRIADLRKKLGYSQAAAPVRYVLQASNRSPTANIVETSTLAEELLLPSPLLCVLDGIRFCSFRTMMD